MTLEELKTEFIKVAKRILKENLSTNPETLETYRIDIVTAYNDCINYVVKINSQLSESKQNSAYTELTYIKNKFTECLEKLNCVYTLPETILKPVLETEIFFNMALTNIQLLRICGETIPQIFTGEPLSLQPFLNALDLLNELATTPALQTLLISFIKTRMNSKAIEFIPTENLTVQLIKNALLTNIKPENEKIIKGKLAALRTDRMSLQEFSKQAESLADGLKRALVLEGLPSHKANQIAIDETINTCKISAKTNYVKSILASSNFSNAKEVVAKFIIESNNEQSEKQVLSFHSFPKKNQNNYKGKNGYYQNQSAKNYKYKSDRNQYDKNQNNSHKKFYKNNKYNKNVRMIQGNEEAPSHSGEGKKVQPAIQDFNDI